VNSGQAQARWKSGRRFYAELVGRYYRVLGGYPVQVAGQRYRCSAEYHWFWQRYGRGRWEVDTLTALDRLVPPGGIYCDVGSWIGPTVLRVAHRCQRVFALEPDRHAFIALSENCRRNGLDMVLPFNLALAAREGLRSMASPRGKQGDSMGSLLLADRPGASEVLALRWQHWLTLCGTPRIDVLKVDIEGGEYALLPDMADYLSAERPILLVSLHPHLLPPARREEATWAVLEAVRPYGGLLRPDGKALAEQTLLIEAAKGMGSCCLLMPAPG
jgi:FkbM family methyltransferase